MVDYSMTKGAIIAFSAALAREATEKGVTQTLVSPGNIITENGRNNEHLSYIGRSGTPSAPILYPFSHPTRQDIFLELITLSTAAAGKYKMPQ